MSEISPPEEPDERQSRPADQVERADRPTTAPDPRRLERTRRRGLAHREIGVLLLVLGVGGLAAAWFVPSERTFLVVLGAIGVFGGLLAFFVDSGQYVSASVGGRVYAAMAETETALVHGLDRAAEPVYLPTSDAAVLYVPRDRDAPLPDGDDLDVPRVTPDPGDGLAFVPTGGPLFLEFRESLVSTLANDPEPLVDQVNEGILHAFELAGDTRHDLDAEAGRLVVDLFDPAFPAGFDTPTASFLAVSFAHGLERPVRSAITSRGDWGHTVTVTWVPAPGTDGR